MTTTQTIEQHVKELRRAFKHIAQLFTALRRATKKVDEIKTAIRGEQLIIRAIETELIVTAQTGKDSLLEGDDHGSRHPEPPTQTA